MVQTLGAFRDEADKNIPVLICSSWTMYCFLRDGSSVAPHALTAVRKTYYMTKGPFVPSIIHKCPISKPIRSPLIRIWRTKIYGPRRSPESIAQGLEKWFQRRPDIPWNFSLHVMATGPPLNQGIREKKWITSLVRHSIESDESIAYQPECQAICFPHCKSWEA